MGEMLREEVDRGRPKETINEKDKTFHDVRFLPDGISYIQSHRFQKAASVPVREFEKHLTHVRETEGGEITTNGILRLASSLERDVRAKGMKATSLTTHPHRHIPPHQTRFQSLYAVNWKPAGGGLDQVADNAPRSSFVLSV